MPVAFDTLAFNNEAIHGSMDSTLLGTPSGGYISCGGLDGLQPTAEITTINIPSRLSIQACSAIELNLPRAIGLFWSKNRGSLFFKLFKCGTKFRSNFGTSHCDEGDVTMQPRLEVGMIAPILLF